MSPEVAPYEHDIRRFVDAMLYKLKVHANKGRWDDYNIHEAVGKLQNEVIELQEAVLGGNTVEVLLEAADVANYGLIVASMKVERG